MSQEEHFRFAKSIAMDLNRDEVKLPSFPDVVVRVRSALDDPDTTAEDLATILGVDAVLASRVLMLANSTYYNPAGVKIGSLDTAVARVGFEKVRSAAISYAVEQLHTSQDIGPLKGELRKTWSEGLRHAALSEVIARHCTRLDADSAFIAGLLHRIGTLYIFAKHGEYPTLLSDAESRQHLIEEWSAPIGESIVGNWKFSREIRETLNPDVDEAPQPGAKASLTDVIIAAKQAMSGDDLELKDTAQERRLQLTEELLPEIRESYKQKLDSLASAVRG